ncbi:hypothetical protein DIJ61_22010 [Burkholderia pseudomallei]|nr:hypothetical protein DIJ61_22010 [Burkholderia pseudomallei]
MRSWTATRHRGQGSRKDTRCALAFSVSASGGSRRREIMRDARRSWGDWMDRRCRLLPHPANGKRQTANGGDCSSYRLLEVGAQQSRMAARMRPALCTGQ